MCIIKFKVWQKLTNVTLSKRQKPPKVLFVATLRRHAMKQKSFQNDEWYYAPVPFQVHSIKWCPKYLVFVTNSGPKHVNKPVHLGFFGLKKGNQYLISKVLDPITFLRVHKKFVGYVHSMLLFFCLRHDWETTRQNTEEKV